MTNEELRQKYRLLRLVVEQDVRTYHALDAAGHIVMVHYLPGHSADSERLLALLDALIPADQMRIVERAEVDGAPVIVTQFIQGFEPPPESERPLVRWKQDASPEAPPLSPPAAAAPPPAPPGPPLPPPPAAVSARPKAPGEMTQLFGPAGGVPAASETPSPTPPREAPPGEFTLLFHDRKPGVAAAPPSEQGPRDYLQALNMPAAPRDAPTPFHPSPPS